MNGRATCSNLVLKVPAGE